MGNGLLCMKEGKTRRVRQRFWNATRTGGQDLGVIVGRSFQLACRTAPVAAFNCTSALGSACTFNTSRRDFGLILTPSPFGRPLCHSGRVSIRLGGSNVDGLCIWPLLQRD